MLMRAIYVKSQQMSCISETTRYDVVNMYLGGIWPSLKVRIITGHIKVG